MTTRDDSRLDVLTTDPPVVHLRGDDGSSVLEPLTHIGIVHAPYAAREELELYAICLDHACFDPHSAGWVGCLFSESALQLLLELRAAGEFSYDIEASPSQAEAEWQVARAAGAT